jgi:Membrane bound O-acyl transferase family
MSVQRVFHSFIFRGGALSDSSSQHNQSADQDITPRPFPSRLPWKAIYSPLLQFLFSSHSRLPLQSSTMPQETLFPHLTATGQAPSMREAMTVYRAVFNARVAEGSLRPFVLPYLLYGMVILVIYLLIPHTNNRIIHEARWLVLAAVCACQWQTASDATSSSMAIGFATGLTSAWGVVWAWTWLVWRRPQWDAKRVQRRNRRTEHNGMANRSAGSQIGNDFVVPVQNGNAEIRKRSQANGHTKEEQGNGHATTNDAGNALASIAASGGENEVEYYWQSYPSTLRERFPWVMDLVMNFRGPGWNWAIPPLPALPPNVKASLNEPIDPDSLKGVSSICLRRFTTRRELFNSRVPRFILGYFALDIIKCIMKADPYYTFGPNTYALPPHLQNLSSHTIRFIRQIISSFAIIISLEMVFYIPSLIISLLFGPHNLGLRAEPWYYPSTWGSFSNVLTKGLNGLWGSWWHQTFRFAFSAPTNYFIREKYFSPKSMTAKISALVFAFGISGFLHAGGSFTQIPKTEPLHAPIFFMLQALGILIQSTFCSIFRSQIKRLPSPVRKTGNFLFTLGWLFETGYWLTDDFARGGLWLYEPIPVSLLRGLGFGDKGDGWWCWEHIGVGWYKGRRWWESGIAL